MKELVKVSVGEVMNSSPHLIDGLATVAEAVAAMQEHRVDYLVVDKRDEHDAYHHHPINISRCVIWDQIEIPEYCSQ